ncbi:Ubiquitin-like-specific protease ESD4 [Cytospora mali]|uniref:Ubiquitin-like-specific protease ESD4 n=1 Tax=Cytospora mali TaxID=578113 RepID=A0A194V7M5_CYTMA|nr:Ubiquitin-like-specific protease ESD4 [Valsa mali var. pyri (nom. inval.)]
MPQKRHSETNEADLTGDVVMRDAPTELAEQSYMSRVAKLGTHICNGIFQGVSSLLSLATPVYQNVVRPFATPVAGRAYNQAVGSLFAARDRFMHDIVEIRQSTDDGLSVKRFKRLPLRTACTKAKLKNTLPISYLKALPDGQYCWTNRIKDHLGAQNHQLVDRWFSELMSLIDVDACLPLLPEVTDVISPLQVPASVTTRVQASGKNETLSILMHNYYIINHKKNWPDEEPDIKTYIEVGKQFIHELKKLSRIYQLVYNDLGRVPFLKQLGFTPLETLEAPDKDGLLSHGERKPYYDCVIFLNFLLDQREAFNQMFPAQTIAGIIADFDALHKDEPPPSYVDWPGKYERVPGAFPDDSATNSLFDTVAMRNFEPVRLYEHKNPSPSKFETYDTPMRNAPQKNAIYWDHKGHARARKPALRTRKTSTAAKKSARFRQSHIQFYLSSNNEPVKRTYPKEDIKKDIKEDIKDIKDIKEDVKESIKESIKENIKGNVHENTTPAVPAAPDAPGAPAASATPGTPNKMSPLEYEIITETMRRAREAEEAATKQRQSSDDSPWRFLAPRNREKLGRKKPKTLDEFFAQDDDWGLGPLKLSREKRDDFDTRKQLIEDASHQAQREAEAEKKRKEEEERRIAEERQRAIEEERRKEEVQRRRAEEELRLAEQKRIQEEDDRLAQTGELRQPHKPVVPLLADQWIAKAQNTLRARPNMELAKTPEGSPLTCKDFATLVTPNQWLNDEVVNGTLLHLANYVNLKAGIKNTRVQTAKVQVFNSFFGKKIWEDGGVGTQRQMRRTGIKKETFLDIEAVLIPICRGAHWTLLVVRPKHKEVFHLDSLSGTGNEALMNKALKWVAMVMEETFVRSDWAMKTIVSPRQSNFDDCGVHTVTNGICIALGIDPATSYQATEMDFQRLRIAGVLLNNGFVGDFSLDGY